MSNNLNHNSHHYAIDAAKLVEKCRRLLHSILDVMESKSSTRAFQRRSYQLASLSDGKQFTLISSLHSSFAAPIIIHVSYLIYTSSSQHLNA